MKPDTANTGVSALLLFSSSLLLLPLPCWSQNVAVIGGGVAGTFTSKYLVDFDREKCKLESITIFDLNPIGQPAASDPNDSWQGSRVSAVQLPDGKVVELGASVFHEANRLVKEMIENDPALEIGKPFNVGQDDASKIPTRVGLGIYNGDGEFSFRSNNTDPWNTFWTVLRYNLDLYKVDKATTKAQSLFSGIPALLNSTDPDTFFESPDDMWRKTDLIRLVHASFERVLDAIWVSHEDSWIQKLLPYQGSLRKELLTAINLINYNQGNSQINGLVGLASFAASKGPLYSVVGGNHQMIKSAFQQAQTNRNRNCPNSDANGKPFLRHQQQTITTIIGSLDGFQLFADETNLGTYDTVVLAAPLQQCRVQFLIPSHIDPAVLQAMPLADGMVNPDQTHDDHEGHNVLPKRLPDHAVRPYTQVVTTVVSGATLNHQHFGLEGQDKIPRAVCTTERGKAKENDITVISEISGDGVFKMFSSNKLDEETLRELFGADHKVEYVKVWGGPHGGATPDYQGGGGTVGYLLYDGATGLSGHTTSGGLFYASAIESSLACMEASAIGAKSVAKLVARRLDILIPEKSRKHDGEEL